MKISVLLLSAAFLYSCGTPKKAAAPVIVKQPANVVKADSTAEKKEEPKVVPEKQREYRIALILQLNAQAQLASDTVENAVMQFSQQSLPSLHFLEAALMAKDSLAKNFRTCSLIIVDAGTDSASAAEALKNKRIEQADAVISLLPPSFLAQTGAASEKWKKPVYVTQASNAAVLEKNPWLRLAYASNYTQIKTAAGFLAAKYPASNFITVYRDQRKEDDLAALFASVIDSSGKAAGKVLKVNYKNGGWNSLQPKLSKAKRNLLIIPTTDEAFLTSVLNSIKEVKNEYSFMLCGLPNWETFETIDPELLRELNTVIFNNSWLDYSLPGITSFRRSFIEKYHSEPLPQAYTAFDLIRLLVMEGDVVSKNKEAEKTFSSLCFPAGGYMFEPACPSCGFENRQVNFLSFGEFSLQKLKE